MEELKYKKIEEIKVDSPLIKSVNFKPIKAPIVCIIAGVAIFFVDSIFAKILGVFFILMAVLVLKFVEDKKIIDVYEKGAVIYKANDQKLACYLDYDLVREWKVSKDNGKYSIIFTLQDKKRLAVDTFEINAVYQALDKVLHDKEERVIQHEKNKKMKWANPVESFKAIVNKINGFFKK